MNTLPDSAQRVADLLTAMGHDKQVVMLPETGKTSAEAAAGLGCSVAEIAKSIVFRRLTDDAAVMVVASGSNRVDEAKVAALVGPLRQGTYRLGHRRCLPYRPSWQDGNADRPGSAGAWQRLGCGRASARSF